MEIRTVEPTNEQFYWVHLVPGDMLIQRYGIYTPKSPTRMLVVQVERFVQMPGCVPMIRVIVMHPARGMMTIERFALDHICNDYDIWTMQHKKMWRLSDIKIVSWLLKNFVFLTSRTLFSAVKKSLTKKEDKYYHFCQRHAE